MKISKDTYPESIKSSLESFENKQLFEGCSHSAIVVTF